MMAKDGKKKSKSAKDGGGAKLPKKLKKAGKKALKLARQPVVSETVAAALLAAAAALRQGQGATASARAAGAAVLDGADQAGRDAGRLSDALRSFAVDMARRTLENWEENRAPGGKGNARRGDDKTPAKG
jgi:hypothetical protein